MLKQSTLLISILSITSFAISSFADNRSEFEQWMKKETTSFQEYRDKRDKEFTGFLQSQWKEMQTFQGLVRDKTPKPVALPKAPKVVAEPVKVDEPKSTKPGPDTKTTPKQTVVSPPAKPVIVEIPAIKPVAPQVKKVKPVVIRPQHPPGTKLVVDFYGQKLVFYYDPKLLVSLPRPINEKAISNIWSRLSKANHESLLKQINAQRMPLSLNDWGFTLLIHKISQQLHPGTKNHQSVFTWYMLTKAGYQARIAYDRNYVYILMPSRQQLFEAPYFNFDNLRYYALSFDGIKRKPGRIFTYNGHYPGAKRRLDMSLNTALNTGRSPRERYLSFSYKQKDYRINVAYDSQTVNYLKTYPQMDISMYFKSEVNQATANPILKQLKPLVEDKSELDAVNLLLRFVQTAFKYKTDQQQFGVENYLFPEETLHYPYSDCEDRSVFFAWLVHNLLGLDVIGLNFPGHIAAAVGFSNEVKGDTVVHNGKKYTVTDPTYTNAIAGMTMPMYKSKKPGVISILN